jgi:tubulin alpha
MDRIRTLADDCDDLQGFFVLSSIGGGTGSGLGSLLLERLSADYAKKTKVSLSVFPSSELSTAVTEPYNSVLALHKLLEHTDVSVVFDNEALCSIDRNFLDVEKPEYRNVNQLTAQVVSSLALSMQTKGNPYSNLDELSSIHVPYSRAHFLLASYSPFIPNERDCFNYRPTTVSAITNSLFKSSNFLANCDPRHGKYLACSIAYRGDVTPSEVNASIKSARSNNCEIQFVDWVPVGFRLGINYTLPHALIGGDLGKVMRSATMLSNTTATIDIFSRMAREFDTFHDKQTHSGQYTQEGMDEDEFR